MLERLTPHERKRHFNMREFGQKTECGTVACAAGFCGLDPWFRRQGFKMNFVTRVITLDQEQVEIELGIDGEYGQHYSGETLKIPVTVTEISDVVEFFGSGAHEIFYNGNKRSVRTVMREIRDHIAVLKAEHGEA